MAVTCPDITTSPVLLKWKLELLISTLPNEPLTNCEGEPNRKDEALNISRLVLPALVAGSYYILSPTGLPALKKPEPLNTTPSPLVLKFGFITF